MLEEVRKENRGLYGAVETQQFLDGAAHEVGLGAQAFERVRVAEQYDY
ncbi:MAG: hypothetical protein HRU01_22875 [Myxococcales bacterium]|nr:hypothetical protein [Myxococcales bacterium]